MKKTPTTDVTTDQCQRQRKAITAASSSVVATMLVETATP